MFSFEPSKTKVTIVLQTYKPASKLSLTDSQFLWFVPYWLPPSSCRTQVLVPWIAHVIILLGMKCSLEHVTGATSIEVLGQIKTGTTKHSALLRRTGAVTDNYIFTFLHNTEQLKKVWK